MDGQLHDGLKQLRQRFCLRTSTGAQPEAAATASTGGR